MTDDSTGCATSIMISSVHILLLKSLNTDNPQPLHHLSTQYEQKLQNIELLVTLVTSFHLIQFRTSSSTPPYSQQSAPCNNSQGHPS